MALAQSISEPRQGHVPAFHLVDEARCTWICDGDRRIGLFYPSELTCDWWAVTPDELLLEHPTLPAHYDMATRLNQHGMIHWRAGGETRPETITVSWQVEDSGVTLTVDGVYTLGGHTRHTFRAWYDAAAGRYRYQMSADLHLIWQTGMEFVNYYPARMLHSHPTQRRYTHTVWRGEDGRWHSFPHNSAIMSGHKMGYQKYLPAEGGEFGMVTDPHCNPFCRVIDASRPLVLATCDQWWDEHLIIPMPSMEERQDGLFHTWATVEWFTRTPDEAAAILAEAEEMPTVPLDARRLQRVPFHVGRVCDFAEDADLSDPAVSMGWMVDMYPAARLATDITFQGRRTLALATTGTVQSLMPNGANMQVGPGGAGRLTAWVNTEHLQGDAWIELRSYRFRHDIIERSYASRHLTAGQGWTQLVIEGVTADSPYLHPFLWVEGKGEAAFADVLFEDVSGE